MRTDARRFAWCEVRSNFVSELCHSPPKPWANTVIYRHTSTRSDVRAMLGAALNVGVTPVEAKEIVYQAVPDAGLAGVFDFIHVTNEVLTERGVTLPLSSQSPTTPEHRFETGRDVQKQIVGSEVVEKLYESAPADQQHIQRFLSANCFGDWVGRGGVDIPTRELLTFSMIAAAAVIRRSRATSLQTFASATIARG